MPAAVFGPHMGALAMLLLLALLWPIYTITGYDASAHTSEETVAAAKNVPKGILRSVYLSGIFGWIMVCSFVLALPSVSEGAAQGGNIFFWLMDKVIPVWLKLPLEIGIVVANYVCGLACLTSTSRMMFAFSRDGGLPGSPWLRKVSPKHGVPVIAIWSAAALTVLCTLYTPAYSTLTAACVIFLYISYVMPTAAGIFAYGKTWKTMGPFDLGAGILSCRRRVFGPRRRHPDFCRHPTAKRCSAAGYRRHRCYARQWHGSAASAGRLPVPHSWRKPWWMNLARLPLLLRKR